MVGRAAALGQPERCGGQWAASCTVPPPHACTHVRPPVLPSPPGLLTLASGPPLSPIFFSWHARSGATWPDPPRRALGRGEVPAAPDGVPCYSSLADEEPGKSRWIDSEPPGGEGVQLATRIAGRHGKRQHLAARGGASGRWSRQRRSGVRGQGADSGQSHLGRCEHAVQATLQVRHCSLYTRSNFPASVVERVEREGDHL